MVADTAMTEVERFKDNVIVEDSIIATTTVRTAHLSHLGRFHVWDPSEPIDTVKFINAQRKLCDYMATRYADVSKLFSYGIETTYEYPETLDFQDEPGKLKAHI